MLGKKSIAKVRQCKGIRSDQISQIKKPMFNKCCTLGWPGEHDKGERDRGRSMQTPKPRVLTSGAARFRIFPNKYFYNESYLRSYGEIPTAMTLRSTMLFIYSFKKLNKIDNLFHNFCFLFL